MHPRVAMRPVVVSNLEMSVRERQAIRVGTPPVENSNPAMSALERPGTRVACQGRLNKRGLSFHSRLAINSLMVLLV